LGIIPYLGDLAKIGKLPKLLKVVENVVSMAKADARFAKVVTPLLNKNRNALDCSADFGIGCGLVYANFFSVYVRNSGLGKFRF
jgi:N-acetyl-gamma-glutamylphosphate reductase